MRPLGEVFVEFLAAAIDGPESSEPEAVSGVLVAAFEIWNAGCRDAMSPGSDNMRAVRERFETVPGVAITCVEMLISRKRTTYSDDHRLIAHVESSPGEDGGLNLILEEAGLLADYDNDAFPGSESGGATVNITRALWEFIAPFVGTQVPEADLRQALEIAVEIWNACVLDSQEEGDAHVGALRRRCNANHWPPRDIVEAMVRRKRRHFGSDLRIVDHCQVRSDDKGEPMIHCAAKGEGPVRHPE